MKEGFLPARQGVPSRRFFLLVWLFGLFLIC